MIGEAEDSALAAGVNVDAITLQTMVISGFFCGLAGTSLSLGYVSLFAKGRPVATTYQGISTLIYLTRVEVST